MENKLSSMRKVFGEELYKLGESNKNIWVVSMDLKSSLCLNKFADKFPDRFVECGIAEQSGAGIAAGLAKGGKTVFLCSFSCFSPTLNLGVIRQSIAYNNLAVKIVGSHSGLMSGDLGATHQMLEDVAIMRSMPNMEVLVPVDSEETKKIVRIAAISRKPTYIRLVRESSEIISKNNSFVIGKAGILKEGEEATIIGYGPILAEAVIAAQASNKNIEVINCSSIKPIDEKTIIKSAEKTKKVIVVEDHQKQGGLGELVAGILMENGVKCKFIHLGIDNSFGQSGKPQELFEHYGIDRNSILKAIKKIC